MVDHIWDVLSRIFVGNMESFPDTFGQMCAVDNKSVQCRQGLLGCSFPSHLGTPMNHGAEQYTHTKLGLCLYIYIHIYIYIDDFPIETSIMGAPSRCKNLVFFSWQKSSPNPKFTTQPLRHQRPAPPHQRTKSRGSLSRAVRVQRPEARRLAAGAGFAAMSRQRRCQVKSVI